MTSCMPRDATRWGPFRMSASPCWPGPVVGWREREEGLAKNWVCWQTAVGLKGRCIIVRPGVHSFPLGNPGKPIGNGSSDLGGKDERSRPAVWQSAGVHPIVDCNRASTWWFDVALSMSSTALRLLSPNVQARIHSYQCLS